MRINLIRKVRINLIYAIECESFVFTMLNENHYHFRCEMRIIIILIRISILSENNSHFGNFHANFRICFSTFTFVKAKKL